MSPILISLYEYFFPTELDRILNVIEQTRLSIEFADKIVKAAGDNASSDDKLIILDYTRAKTKPCIFEYHVDELLEKCPNLKKVKILLPTNAKDASKKFKDLEKKFRFDANFARANKNQLKYIRQGS